MLLLGLPAAAFIYFNADEAAAGTTPYHTKTYVRELQRFGGKASVLFDELMRRFADLWEGKSLGITIAFLTVAVAASLFAFAARLPAPRRRSSDKEQ